MLQIYCVGSLSLLLIKALSVLEECWSVYITSNKIIFTAEVMINAFEMHRENLFYLFSYLRNNII